MAEDLAGPIPEHPLIPQATLDELVQARRIAKDYVAAFGDAVKDQAEKYRIKPGALRKYVAALEADTVEELDAESDDLARLLERTE